MSRAKEGSETARFCRDAWLVIATEGGWWKQSEVRNALKVDARVVANRLIYMQRRNYLVRRDIPEDKRTVKLGPRTGCRERVEYAVTAQCVIPTGLTAAEVSTALFGGVAA